MRWNQIQEAYNDKLKHECERSQKALRAVRMRMNGKMAQDVARQHSDAIEGILGASEDMTAAQADAWSRELKGITDDGSEEDEPIDENDAVDAASQRIDRLKQREKQERVNKKRAEIQKTKKQIRDLQK